MMRSGVVRAVARAEDRADAHDAAGDRRREHLGAAVSGGARDARVPAVRHQKPTTLHLLYCTLLQYIEQYSDWLTCGCALHSIRQG